ncbi:MAG TPA: hypothetical protein ENH29_00630 [Bacteroidetes bacterium]|nr:hypothetical protein [Bacteroidota bacterium]
MYKKIILIVFTILLSLFFYLKCQKSPTNHFEPSEIVDVSHFSIQNYPKVDGSTSTHPLQIVIACKILGAQYRWEDYGDGTRRARATGSDKTITNYINGITHHGTHSSYVNLLTDSAEIIIVAREPSEDEINLSDSLGLTLITKGIALDAFVFILNIENPVNNLTLKQIQNIYSGNILNWREVGGADAAINPYQRNQNSGSQELMETLVMEGLHMIDAPAMILHSMMGPINRLVEDPYGLGYTVYFFNQYMAARDKIKLCWINGIEPNYESLSNGDYVFTTKVVIAIRSDLDKNSTAFTLWKWLQTKAGREAIADSKYIPINLN